LSAALAEQESRLRGDVDALVDVAASFNVLLAEAAHNEVLSAMIQSFVALMVERGYPDLRAGHTPVFIHIDRRSGTRLTELARRARMTKQGMMLIIDDLEGRGYVRRVPDPEDGRAKVVKLTAHGRRCTAEYRRAIQALESQCRRMLGDRAYEILREALDELSASREPFEEECVRATTRSRMCWTMVPPSSATGPRRCA
jgi:DNA-binding MarR family transcriptional regulator